MFKKKWFAIICSLCLVVAMLVPNLGFAEEGDGSGGTTTTTSTFKMIVHYANGATGTVQYKDNNDSTWQTATLTLQSNSTDTYEATLTDVPTGRFSIRAIPGENCEMDTGRKVTLTYNNSTWEYEATSISTENGKTFDLGWPEYEIEFGFDNAGTPGGENPPAEGNSYEIALDNVNEGGTLSADLGSVQYAVVDANTSEVHPVNLNTDYDGNKDRVTLTTSNTGGDNPKVKYTYTVKDTSKQFMLYVTPAEGKTATIKMGNQGNMTQIGSVSSSDSPNFLVRNVAPNVRYRVEFTDTGSQPGGNTDGPDWAPEADAATLQFYDRQGNNLTYEEFKRANLGTVQYFDGNDWKEFTSEQVNDDENLFWYTDKTDQEPANWKQIYYFNDENVQIKVTEGALRHSESEDGSNSLDFGLNQPYHIFKKSTGEIINNVYIFPQDDGVKNITWSDEADEASQKVENGKVIITNAVIGEENALSKDPQYSQSGNKGYVGVKGGATVTVKLIPDYGYQVGSLELNGQKLTPQEEEATYTFTMPNTNLHLRAIFKESSDEIKANATDVSGGSITGGENVINSGNLRLSVSDSNMTDAQKNEMQNSLAGSNTDILNYLEVDLERFVNKGDRGDEWTEDLEELSDKISITLNVGTNLDEKQKYVVVREHNGVYEQIPATYDKNEGTLTFASDKFSDYAIATVDEDAITELNYTEMPFEYTNGAAVADSKGAKVDTEYRYFGMICKYNENPDITDPAFHAINDADEIYVPEEYIAIVDKYYTNISEEDIRLWNAEFGKTFDKNYYYSYVGMVWLNDNQHFGNSVTFNVTYVDEEKTSDVLEGTSTDKSVYWSQFLDAKNAGGTSTDKPNTGGAAGTDSPETGDNSNMALPLALAAAALLGGTAVFARRRHQ